MHVQELMAELTTMPIADRLTLARMLIDSAIAEPATLGVQGQRVQPNGHSGLLAMAGRYAGGPGDSAERTEEILEAGVSATSGLSLA
ncbi:MAG: hypothetical protein V9H69_25075 [Anaerolineae bacterium]